MTKAKSAPTKRKSKSAPVVDGTQEVSPAQIVVTDLIESDLPVSTVLAVMPKDQLLFVASVLGDLLPIYSGPGRRYIEAARSNIDQAIRYTP